MRSSLYKSISIAAIICFIGYWIFVAEFSVSQAPKNKTLLAVVSKPTKWFVFNWRFFAKPGTSIPNMYLIAKHQQSEKLDTIELIRPVTMRKQQEAPFNQQANILDHFLHYYTASIHRNANKLRDALEKDYPGRPGKFYADQLPPLLRKSKDAGPAAIALGRYCKMILKQQATDDPYTSFKYLLTSKNIPRHSDAGSTSSPEIVVYDSGYSPI